MTLPRERTLAIINVREFLYSLLRPSDTPKVPRWIRLQARSCLKHYPTGYDMALATEYAPSIFEAPDDDSCPDCGGCGTGRTAQQEEYRCSCQTKKKGSKKCCKQKCSKR